MLHFFRKIRRDLLANSQFFKYLKYAVGEIVLVVLGILIALQINNWNEEKANRSQFDKILVEVEQELIENIQNTRRSLEEFHPYDSVYKIILFDKLTEKNFENDTSFLFRNIPWYPIDYEIIAFNKLLDIGMGKTLKQDSIYQNLTVLYKQDRINQLQKQTAITQDLKRKISESREEYDWFTNSLLLQPYNQEEINYYVNNPSYKKQIAQLASETLNNITDINQVWEYYLLENYENVYYYLEEKNITHSDSLQFGYNPSQFKHYIGKYKINATTSFESNYFKDQNARMIMEIELVNNKMILTFKSDREEPVRVEIIPVTKHYFRTKDPNIRMYGNLAFDRNDKVLGMTLGAGIGHGIWTKID